MIRPHDFPRSQMKKLLIVSHTPSPHTRALTNAVVDGATHADISGIEVIRRIKSGEDTKIDSEVPIVVLSTIDNVTTAVEAMRVGAFDYVTKPFSPRILIARTRAIIRRGGKEPPDETTVIQVHDIEIHPGRRSVTVQGKPVNLTYAEFQVLSILARRPGWVFTRSQIVDMVRGDDYPVTDRSVDVQIVGLRKKLGPLGKYIETVRGVGYRFSDAFLEEAS